MKAPEDNDYNILTELVRRPIEKRRLQPWFFLDSNGCPVLKILI